jgi:hypothetical protein
VARKKKRKSLSMTILSAFVLLTAVVFMPTTVIVLFGMLPTIVIVFFDSSKKKTKAMTVGFLNFAGCTPFILHLWHSGHAMENAVMIAFDPRFMIVMCSAAGIGHLIDWAMSGIVGTVMLERGKSRIEEIKKHQKSLIDRWGVEVTGDVPLDSQGFPIHDHVSDEQNDSENKGK